MFDRGMAMLGRHIAGNAGTAITYTRGEDSVELNATLGLASQDRVEDNAPVTSRRVDFIVRAADLVIGGAATLPAAGDVITFNGSDYDVRPEADEDVYRPLDGSATLLRVHGVRRGAA